MSISVLIVEDNREKLRAIQSVLTDSGVLRETVDVALTAWEARDKLQASKYDLMILDLVLPVRPEDDPTREAGFELLIELSERDIYNRPSHIVAATAFEEVSHEFDEAFRDQMVILLHFDPSSERWKSQLERFVKRISALDSEPVPVVHSTDVCIVTALRNPELAAVRRLPYNFDLPRPVDDSTYIFEGTLDTGNRSFSIAASAAPRMGLVAAALHAQKLVRELQPRLLIMCGICAGVAGRSKIGDVILANPAWEWQSGKQILQDGDSRFMSDPHHLNVEQSIIARFENLAEDSALWAKTQGSFAGPVPETLPRGIVGPMASGSMVVADGRIVQDIASQQHRKLVGLDMEVYGVYAAAKGASKQTPLVLALKSVSDLGDSDKSDDFQDYAAHMSASVMHEYLLRNLDDMW